MSYFVFYLYCFVNIYKGIFDTKLGYNDDGDDDNTIKMYTE